MRWKKVGRGLLGLLVLVPLVGACASKSAALTAPASPSSLQPIAAPAPAPSVVADSRRSELEELGSDGYLWGFAIVENYKAIYAYNVDKNGPEYKGPFNALTSQTRVYTPADKAVITPNSDTPYGFAVLDLRAEPELLTVPAVEKSRYYSVQLIDGYLHNFAYIGTRATGNKPGRYLVTGPGFKGDPPAGVDGMIRSETDLVMVVYRTQLFNPQDIESVKKIQAGYTISPLHELTKTPAPKAAAPLDFPAWDVEAVKGLRFFAILDFLLDFMPGVPEDEPIRKRLLEIGVGAPGKFDENALTEMQRDALLAGMQRGQKKLAELTVDLHFLDHEVTSADLFGNRAFLQGDVRRRDVGAVLGIYGNSREEALYPIYRTDAAGKPLDGSVASYSLHFEKGKLPPAKAFWSVTMYDGRTKLLVDNPLNRYLINSPMLRTLKQDKDGGITLTLAYTSPGKALESNWLPAPNGPFYAVLRIYDPEPAAYDGSWRLPSLVAVAPLAAAPAAGHR